MRGAVIFDICFFIRAVVSGNTGQQNMASWGKWALLCIHEKFDSPFVKS